MTSITHAPIVIPSPGGTDTIPTVHGCSCGEKPSRGATSMSTMSTWIRVHGRKHDVRFSPADFLNATYGPGCAAVGYTENEWRAANPGRSPIAGAASARGRE